MKKLAIRELLEKVKVLLEESFKPDGFNVGFNLGHAAGQTVFHVHFHVIPWYDWKNRNN